MSRGSRQLKIHPIAVLIAAVIAIVKITQDRFASSHMFFYFLIACLVWILHLLFVNVRAAFVRDWSSFQAFDYGESYSKPQSLGVAWTMIGNAAMLGLLLLILYYVNFDPSSATYPQPATL